MKRFMVDTRMHVFSKHSSIILELPTHIDNDEISWVTVCYHRGTFYFRAQRSSSLAASTQSFDRHSIGVRSSMPLATLTLVVKQISRIR